MKEIFSFLAGAFTIAGFAPYIYSIIQKKTIPSKASWVVWAVVDTITLFGMFAKDTMNGQMLAVIGGVWTVMVLSLVHGEPKWTNLDKFCLGASAVGLAAWAITSNATVAIMISLVIVDIAAVPTFTHAWKKPEDENKAGWLLWGAGCVFTLLGITEWSWASAAQPVVYTINNTIMLFIIFWRLLTEKAGW